MKRYKICPGCGTHNDPTAIECIQCEEDLTTTKIVDEETAKKPEAVPASNTKRVKICFCGTKNPANARKCIICGDDISTIVPQPDIPDPVGKYVFSSLDGIYTYELKPGKTVIGRENEMSEYLKDKSYVSRKHAEISIDGNNIYITSFGANHTFINNTKISDNKISEIKPGDTVSFGGNEINGARQDFAAYFRLDLKRLCTLPEYCTL